MIPSPAQNEPYERIGEGFRGQTGSSESGLVALALVGALVVAAILAALVLSSRRGGAGRKLFRELSRASALSGAESRLLLEVALRAEPGDPAAIFVRRSAFEAAARDGAFDPGAIDLLRKKVYGP
jgi:hypothetical protein